MYWQLWEKGDFEAFFLWFEENERNIPLEITDEIISQKAIYARLKAHIKEQTIDQKERMLTENRISQALKDVLQAFEKKKNP